MKKIVLMALVVLASATAFAGSSKKKVKTQKPQPVQIQLATVSDSLSYAAGINSTNGLMGYLKQNYGVDSTNIADFVEAFKEGVSSANSAKFKARSAGYGIANTLVSNILPKNVQQFEGSPDSISAVKFIMGFLAGINNDSTFFTTATAEKFYNDRAMADMAAKALATKNAGDAWLAENSKKEGVVTMPSGLQYKIITAGTGEKPLAEDEVTVKYEGKLINGTVFDSSYKRNPQTAKFRCNQVIKGWTEALTMMPVGSKWEIYVPQDLAYGQRQMGQIPAFSPLVFTVELVSVAKAPVKAAETAKKELTPAEAKKAAKEAAKDAKNRFKEVIRTKKKTVLE